MISTLPQPVRARGEASGRLWAASILDQLAAGGRAAAGGFPGTLPEARMRAGVVDGAVALSTVQRTELARAVYASARVAWRAKAARKLGE